MIHKTCNVIFFLGMEDRWPETFEALLMSLSAAASNFHYMIAYLMMILFNTRNPQYTCNHDMQVLSRQFLAFYECCYFPNGKIYRSKDEPTPNCGHLEAFYLQVFEISSGFIQNNRKIEWHNQKRDCFLTIAM